MVSVRELGICTGSVNWVGWGQSVAPLAQFMGAPNGIYTYFAHFRLPPVPILLGPPKRPFCEVFQKFLVHSATLVVLT